MENLEKLLVNHPFFRDLKREYLPLFIECARNAQYREREYIFREGGHADHFYVILTGKVALELHVPGQGPVIIQTLHAGEMLGWSWLFPPYRWHFDARVTEPVELIALNGLCLRPKCDTDPALGYELMKRFAQLAIERLQATRMQFLEFNEFRSVEKRP